MSLLIIISPPNTHHPSFQKRSSPNQIHQPSLPTFQILTTSTIMHFLRSSVVAFAISLAPVARAADCTSGSDIYTQDIRILADNFYNNNLNPQVGGQGVDLPGASSYWATQGSAKACIHNDYIFEHTHDSLSDIAGGISNIADQCCSTDQCGGGYYTVKGDTGLNTRLNVVQSGVNCD